MTNHPLEIDLLLDSRRRPLTRPEVERVNLLLDLEREHRGASAKHRLAGALVALAARLDSDFAPGPPVGASPCE